MRAGLGRGVGVAFLLMDVGVRVGAFVLAAVLDAAAGDVPQPAINNIATPTTNAMGSHKPIRSSDLMRASMLPQVYKCFINSGTLQMVNIEMAIISPSYKT